MRNSFSGYYPPTQEEYERLWREALIVLDTNVLLNLYRLPTTARDELFSVLDVLKDRLWIPHQVALEFQRKRLSVIATEKKSTEDALAYASELMSDLTRRVDTLQLDKRGLGIDPKSLVSELEKANSQLIDAIKSAHESQQDISSSDVIRDRVDKLFALRVGASPSSQEDLDQLVGDGEDRYQNRIPPGFMDADKEKNPSEATFVFDRIRYQRKFGDLILWRQLIQFVKEKSKRTVLLITADRKEDWWWREQGKTIGPHPELIREIQRDGGVEIFWMYSSVQFVEHANKYTAAKVSSQSVEEIKQVAMAAFDPNKNYLRDILLGDSSYPDNSSDRSHLGFVGHRFDFQQIERCVGEWLIKREGHVRENERGFPDFLVDRGGSVQGFEVKYVRQFDRMQLTPSVVNAALRGYLETNEGRLDSFTLVLVIPAADFFELVETQQRAQLLARLGRLLKKYPIDSIIVGAVIDDRFEMLVEQSIRFDNGDRSFWDEVC